MESFRSTRWVVYTYSYVTRGFLLWFHSYEKIPINEASPVRRLLQAITLESVKMNLRLCCRAKLGDRAKENLNTIDLYILEKQ